MNDFLVEYREYDAEKRFSLLDLIYVERGTREDWDLFHSLHYKAESLGVYPRVYRIALNETPIGCIVFTVPRITLAGRNAFLKNIGQNKNGVDTQLMQKYRTKWINNNLALLSRIVLDTTFRGVGIAYRAQNIAMRMTGLPMLEFQSSMSRVNPFAQKAGIVFTKPKRSAAYEKGVVLFKRWFKSIPTDYVGIYEEFTKLSNRQRERCLEELRNFYYNYSCIEKSGDKRLQKRARVEALPVNVLIKSLQQLVFAFPMYGAYLNPDAGHIIEGRVPLTVFDKTPINKPINEQVLATSLQELEEKTKEMLCTI